MSSRCDIADVFITLNASVNLGQFQTAASQRRVVWILRVEEHAIAGRVFEARGDSLKELLASWDNIRDSEIPFWDSVVHRIVRNELLESRG